MSLDFQIDGKRFSVDGRDEAIFVNGKRSALDFRVLRPGFYSLLIDGLSYEVYVREKNGAYWVDLKGHLIEVTKEDPLGSVASLPSAGKVISPMPGRVIGIKVKEGDAVKPGEGLIIVEAMKMENELASPRTGKVTRILVEVGQTVEAGQELVTIE